MSETTAHTIGVDDIDFPETEFADITRVGFITKDAQYSGWVEVDSRDLSELVESLGLKTPEQVARAVFEHVCAGEDGTVEVHTEEHQNN